MKRDETFARLMGFLAWSEFNGWGDNGINEDIIPINSTMTFKGAVVDLVTSFDGNKRQWVGDEMGL